ncbi:MAG: DinB family protein [Anaerolineales bacterium]|nr:DinB family protein [Anaerolineales bacterium]
MTELTALHTRTFNTLRLNLATLENIFQRVTAEQATTLRDGPNGWTPLEILCHLRDFDVIFRERGELLLMAHNPTFAKYDADQLASERAYNQQSIAAALAELKQNRAQLLAFFESLPPEQWARTGVHFRLGPFTMTDVFTHIAWHDANHLEQLTRVLAQT